MGKVHSLAIRKQDYLLNTGRECCSIPEVGGVLC